MYETNPAPGTSDRSAAGVVLRSKSMARDNKLLSRVEAAQALNVCLRSIDNYLAHGQLRAVRRPLVGLRMGTYIRRTDIERFQRLVATRADANSR